MQSHLKTSTSLEQELRSPMYTFALAKSELNMFKHVIRFIFISVTKSNQNPLQLASEINRVPLLSKIGDRRKGTEDRKLLVIINLLEPG